MKQLLFETRASVEAELIRAQVNHGRTYHSPHEGYGVLTEEVFEADTERGIISQIYGQLIRALHANDTSRLIDIVEEIGEHATLAACEFVQVAAVAKKMIETLREVEQ